MIDLRKTKLALQGYWVECMGLLQNLPSQNVVQVLIFESPDVLTECCLCPLVHISEGAVVSIHSLLEQVSPPSICDCGVL